MEPSCERVAFFCRKDFADLVKSNIGSDGKENERVKGRQNCFRFCMFVEEVQCSAIVAREVFC